MNAEPAAKSSAGRKSLMLAVLLQCIPLLGASSCYWYAAKPEDVTTVVNPLVIFLLFWGLGYAYVGRGGRFLLTFVCGPLFFLVSCGVVSSGVQVDFEHGPTTLTTAEANSVRSAAVTEGLILSGVILLLAVDALRLAAAHNASLQQAGRGQRAPIARGKNRFKKPPGQSDEQHKGRGPP